MLDAPSLPRYIRPMTCTQFSHVDTWVFDLDNTLYPPEAHLLEQLSPRMTDWIAANLGLKREQADELREDYWARYGTTAAGLMAKHDVAPAAFLAHAHDLPLDALKPAPELAAAIAALPGRHLVFTNSPVDWAHRVLKETGLDHVFDAVHGAEDAQYIPKPKPQAFSKVFEVADIAPQKAAFFEDDSRNLEVPARLGMRTVHVSPNPETAPYIHHGTQDLTAFLRDIA